MHQRFQHLRVQFSDLLLMGDGQNQSPHRRSSQRHTTLGHKVMILQKLTDVRLAVVVMHIFDILRQSLQKQLRIVFNENHVAGIGQPFADGKNRLCRTFCGRQAGIFAQCPIGNSVKLRVNALQNRENSISLDS